MMLQNERKRTVALQVLSISFVAYCMYAASFFGLRRLDAAFLCRSAVQPAHSQKTVPTDARPTLSEPWKKGHNVFPRLGKLARTGNIPPCQGQPRSKKQRRAIPRMEGRARRRPPHPPMPSLTPAALAARAPYPQPKTPGRGPGLQGKAAASKPAHLFGWVCLADGAETTDHRASVVNDSLVFCQRDRTGHLFLNR